MRIVEKPEKSDEQLVESLVRMHTEILQPLELVLAELLRCPLRLSLLSIDRRRFSDSIVHASTPCCSMQLKLPGTTESWMVDMGPCLVLPVAHRLLGGNTSIQLKPDRSFTSLERRLMRCIVRPLVSVLQQQWAAILPGPLEMVEETTASRWLAAEDEVYQVVFSLSLQQHQGLMTLCMPSTMLDAVADAVVNWKPPVEASPEQQSEVAISPDEVQLSVHLPTVEIGHQEIEQLLVGEILHTGIAADGPLELHLDGIPRYQSEAGQVDGTLAVRITGSLDPGLASDELPVTETPPSVEKAAD
ncbi:MAG: FliM/FliN family flagellar motor switch protein [Planctomycetota bacterium]|nr:FliM/FliN family flagellar motor switch protein [Planctomycetota bacterium]